MSNGRLKYRFGVLSLLMMIVALGLVSAMLASCGKESNASPTGLNTQLNVINLGPDLYPVDLYIANRKQNSRTYKYGIPSGYVYLQSLEIPLQIRNYLNTTIFEKDTALATNCKYTIFLTGLLSDNTRRNIFVADTDAIPTVGRAKVRFINASARTVNLDVYANSTLAYKNAGFVSVSKYVEMPAGVYDFKVYATGTTTVYAALPNTTVQDGRLYTLYTRGVVGRTDTAAFAASMITNR
jgi:hypothetical protein